MTAGSYGQMRASDADRDGVTSVLSTAFVEGRLTKDEYDERVTQLYAAKTYAELDALTADLPKGAVARPSAEVVPADPGTNPLAVASLICGLFQFVFPPVPTVLAIALGYTARGQIRRSGGQGAGMAGVGLVLGWLGLAVGLLVILGMAVHVLSGGGGTFGGVSHFSVPR
jgi:hypothetical protein